MVPRGEIYTIKPVWEKREHTSPRERGKKRKRRRSVRMTVFTHTRLE